MRDHHHRHHPLAAAPRLLLAAAMTLMAACTSVDCVLEHNVRTAYAIYQGETPDTLHDTLTVTSRRRNGKDTLLLNRGVNISAFKLQISRMNPTDTLVFTITDTLGGRTSDTLWLSKRDMPHFESVDCQALYFHQIEDVRYTRQRIDTIIINSSFVDNDPYRTHFHITFKNRR